MKCKFLLQIFNRNSPYSFRRNDVPAFDKVSYGISLYGISYMVYLYKTQFTLAAALKGHLSSWCLYWEAISL